MTLDQSTDNTAYDGFQGGSRHDFHPDCGSGGMDFALVFAAGFGLSGVAEDALRDRCGTRRINLVDRRGSCQKE